MKVDNIVQKKFVSFRTDDTLKYILKKFIEHKIDSAPVFDEREFVGVVCYKSILKHFKPKKFLFLWKRGEKREQEDKIGKTPASKLMCRPVVLRPEMEVTDALEKIIQSHMAVVVMDKKNFVGILRSTDVINFFLKDLAKEHYVEQQTGKSKTALNDVETDLDKILHMVEKEGKISAKKISDELGITVKTVENLAESLDRHHLLKLNYSFLGGAELMRLDYGKK